MGLLGEDGGTVGDDVGGAAEADAVDVEGLAEAEPGAAEGGIEGGEAEGGGFVGEGKEFEDEEVGDIHGGGMGSKLSKTSMFPIISQISRPSHRNRCVGVAPRRAFCYMFRCNTQPKGIP